MATPYRLVRHGQVSERGATRTLTIDGDSVTVLVERLTVGEADAVSSSCAYPRGASRDEDSGHLKRIAAIDRHMCPGDNEVLVDGLPVSRLGSLFGARADIIATLYAALLNAQAPSAVEAHALSVAVRFGEWLADARKRDSESEWAKTGTDCGACHALNLCAKRHCDGSISKKVVWHDKKHILKTCPVLSFTPEVERILSLFSWTHEVAFEGPGIPRYRRVALPVGTSLSEQEAWTLSAIGVVRHEYNELLAERIPEKPRG